MPNISTVWEVQKYCNYDKEWETLSSFDLRSHAIEYYRVLNIADKSNVVRVVNIMTEVEVLVMD